MCGIFAYLNHKTPRTREHIIKLLIEGLKRLEYRGYDSAGIGIDSDKSSVLCLKRVGKVAKLEEAANDNEAKLEYEEVIPTHCGIAHTRWATHGRPSESNCHPHRSENNDFIVVHNGIITNYKQIKDFLQTRGYTFESDTDTEVIAKLVAHIHKEKPGALFRNICEEAVLQLEGAFALCFKSRLYPGECVATRKGSPLLVGFKAEKFIADSIPVQYSYESNDPKKHSHCPEPHDENPSCRSDVEEDDGAEIGPAPEHDAIEYFFASDASAIIEHTNRVLYLHDNDIASVLDGKLSIHQLKKIKSGDSTSRDIDTLTMQIQEIMKGSFDTFMLKEIFEQPESVCTTMAGRIDKANLTVTLGGITAYVPEIKRCRRLLLLGCGTSYISAIATRQILEEHTELPVMIDLASDFLDRSTPIFRDDVCFFISQSGETADTLEALRYCKKRGALIIGITNTVGSTICRESHCGVHINAGPEIGVASTKAYTSQIVSLVMFALIMSEDRISFVEKRKEIIQGLANLPELLREVLKQDKNILEIAKSLHEHKSLLILGRGYNFATCLEAALKVKELTYMHSEGIQSGELKHGPLALVDQHCKMILFMTRDSTFEHAKMAANQIISRGGKPIIVCEKGDTEAKDFAVGGQIIEVPSTVAALQGIISVVPMQLLAYHIATLKGCNVDCPRNLAKSVTVL